jgi:hypothetical protein
MNKQHIPGNAFDWIGRAEKIADRIYHFRNIGIMWIEQRESGDAWTKEQCEWSRKITFQIERDAVRRVLEKWLREDRILNCRIIREKISGQCSR